MISMIASVGKNLELGIDNKLIWRIPGDMNFFKNITWGHPIVMGWNTYKSLPGKLPGREMIVLSRSKDDDSVHIVKDEREIIDKYLDSEVEVFIIGGATIYRVFIDYANTLYLTEIDDEAPLADSFFPNFDKNLWNDTILAVNVYNNMRYKIHKYVRK